MTFVERFCLHSRNRNQHVVVVAIGIAHHVVGIEGHTAKLYEVTQA